MNNLTTRLQSNLPSFVKLVEVGPRDGLQNEKALITTAEKIRLINMLSDAGFLSIEAGSFVSPKWVPQMADSAEVLKQIKRRKGVGYPCLTPNIKGFELAIAAGVEEVAIFGAASESFSQKNINCSIDESIERFIPLCEQALAKNIKIRGYVSCVMGCPYEGDILIAKVVDVVKKLLDMGCYEISLGDTIGTGTPLQTQKLIDALLNITSIDKLAGHFHDSYGQALANIFAAMQMGVAIFDTSIAGLGGCPYAKGASGNVASEDVLYMLRGCNIESNIDFDLMLKASSYISNIIGRPAISKVAQALLSD